MRGSVHWPRRLCSRRLAGGRKVGRGLPRWIKVCGSHLFTSGRRSGWWLGLGRLWWWIWPLPLRHTKAAELIDLSIRSVAFIGPILNEILRWHARPHVDDVSASAWFVRNFGAIWVRRVSAAAKRAYTPENGRARRAERLVPARDLRTCRDVCITIPGPTDSYTAALRLGSPSKK